MMYVCIVFVPVLFIVLISDSDWGNDLLTLSEQERRQLCTHVRSKSFYGVAEPGSAEDLSK